MSDLIAVHNGKHKSKTLRALEAAKKAASGSAKSTIQDLISGLKSNPTAARGRHSQGASMAKRKRSGHKKVARKKSNPTTTHHTKRRHTRRRSNPTRSGHSLKSLNLGSLALRGAATAGGGLGQSFMARQSEKLMPGLPSVVHQLIGTGVVAGAALWLGKGKGLAEDAAIGAISTGLTGLAREFMPGVFAGAEEEAYVAGYQDAAEALNGADDDNPMGALSFNDGMGALDVEPEMGGLYLGPTPSLSRRPDNL